MARFEDKVVLITGGAQGMGRSHVEAFVAEGAFVFFTDLLDLAGLELEKTLAGRARFIRQDVSDENGWKHVAEIIGAHSGRLDVLVNNAGISAHANIGEMNLDGFMKVIRVNQASVFLGLTHCFALLKKGVEPAVVNISSVAGVRATPGSIAYSGSKAAVKSMTEVAAQEWASHGIRVNTVCPGVIETPMVTEGDVKDFAAEVAKSNLLQRLGRPIELSKAVLYLASSDSSFVTGAHLVVDGGSIAKFS